MHSEHDKNDIELIMPRKTNINQIQGSEELRDFLADLRAKLATAAKTGRIEGAYPNWVKTQEDAELYGMLCAMKVANLTEPKNLLYGPGKRFKENVLNAGMVGGMIY